jgi:hypothetical protein
MIVNVFFYSIITSFFLLVRSGDLAEEMYRAVGFTHCGVHVPALLKHSKWGS